MGRSGNLALSMVMQKNYPTILREIFDQHVAAPALSLADEHAAITAAQAGDPEATVLLMYVYGPALANAARMATRSRGRVNARVAGYGTVVERDVLDELRATLVVGFLEAVHKFDVSRGLRLAATVKLALQDALSESDWDGNAPAFTVSARTLRRFYGLMAEAGQDLEVAVTLAAKHHMRPETVRDVYRTLRQTSSYDGLTHADDEEVDDVLTYATPLSAGDALDEMADADVRMMAETALASLGERETAVVRLAYGFDGDPMPITKVATALGLGRKVVRNAHESALAKMRAALGADLREEPYAA
ncbi:DNA binding protein [Arthrobacter phage Emotion]|uniref:DNA binding protein n=1 Tax=Arthrobacter phage Emotion TaxID=3038361 RepID=A0AA49IEN2_9CAUD|nr:DNA binding protein [Arthrobacter phage Emotion]